MKFLGNILWLILGGIIIAIIGIPWGVQHFKMAIATVFPFGKEIRNKKVV